ncbi:MAG: hypothetical protein H6862_05510 [Rhodospirillales bacterium]|nr:hypothetical protein [Rhodospirillales bacterium]
MYIDFKSAVAGGALVALVANGGIGWPQEPVCLSVQTGETLRSLCLNFLTSASGEATSDASPEADATQSLEELLKGTPLQAPVSPPSSAPSVPDNSVDPDMERRIQERVKAMQDPCNIESLFQKKNQGDWNPSIVLPTCT